jgi:hypothetical protein
LFTGSLGARSGSGHGDLHEKMHPIVAFTHRDQSMWLLGRLVGGFFWGRAIQSWDSGDVMSHQRNKGEIERFCAASAGQASPGRVRFANDAPGNVANEGTLKACSFGPAAGNIGIGAVLFCRTPTARHLEHAKQGGALG